MSLGIVVLLVLVGAAAIFVAAPLLRADPAAAERGSERLGQARDLQSRHDMLLASLKDLEDDRATDKIDEADYLELKARLSAQAIEVMKQRDGLAEAEARERRAGPRPLPDPDASPEAQA